MKNTNIRIFDTTLRDGEQSPGVSLSPEKKLNIARKLDELGVDAIETGFPVISEGEREGVKLIVGDGLKAELCGLARTNKKDIDAAVDCGLNYIHTFIATSDIHLEHKLKMSRDEALEKAIEAVEYGKSRGLQVEFSAEDATRTDREFLKKVFGAVASAGADRIDIPDTVGYSTPQYIGEITKDAIEVSKLPISVHCHNDFGLAVANAISGVQAGASCAHVTINGIGERAGNAALEELVMSMKVRKDILNYESKVDTTLFTRASRLVSSVTSFPVQYNKAIVGKNAFAHESGIHQDGMLKNNETYEIMTPESIGLSESTLVMGKHSGRHAFKEKAFELGYELADNQLNDAFYRFKDLADKKKEIFDDDIIAIIDDEFSSSLDHIKLISLKIEAGTFGPQIADLSLEIDNKEISSVSEGSGPVDAIFNAIKNLFPHNADLQLYQVHAVTQGTDAQAEVSVRLHEDGKTVVGRGADTDTLVASARAYIAALNRLIIKREKNNPN